MREERRGRREWFIEIERNEKGGGRCLAMTGWMNKTGEDDDKFISLRRDGFEMFLFDGFTRRTGGCKVVGVS